MARKCPPGVICIENVTITFLICALVIILLYFYYSGFSPSNPSVIVNREIIQSPNQAFPRWNVTNTEAPRDILMNPYSPPLKLDRYMPPMFSPIDPRGVPINVRTRGYLDAYRQVGLLTRLNGKETILPLMGRPLFRNRDKWNFYTMNDKNSMIKLPISFKNKSCTSQQGCDNVYDGDNVYVEGFNDVFRVTIYDNNNMEYIPYL